MKAENFNIDPVRIARGIARGIQTVYVLAGFYMAFKGYAYKEILFTLSGVFMVVSGLYCFETLIEGAVEAVKEEYTEDNHAPT